MNRYNFASAEDIAKKTNDELIRLYFFSGPDSADELDPTGNYHYNIGSEIISRLKNSIPRPDIRISEWYYDGEMSCILINDYPIDARYDEGDPRNYNDREGWARIVEENLLNALKMKGPCMAFDVWWYDRCLEKMADSYVPTEIREWYFHESMKSPLWQNPHTRPDNHLTK